MNAQDLRLDTVHELVRKAPRLGKTKLQKLTYFLQESAGVPLGYQFKMHHYGPYSEGLETDTARLRLAGHVRVDQDPNGYGFQITATTPEPDEEWHGSVLPYGGEVTQILNNLGRWPISKLELAATLHFVEKLSPNVSPREIINKTMALKPKFEEEYVLRVYDELVQLGMVKPR